MSTWGGVVLAFIASEAALLASPLATPIVRTFLGGRMSWLFVLGAFMLVGWVADRWARSATSPAMQYLGLGLYVVAEAMIMVPLLYVAAHHAKDPNIIPTAGVLTGLVFTGLTGTVFLTRHDFSWMRPALVGSGFAALGLIVASILFGFSPGMLFAAVMVVVAAGYILYDTSNVLHHYPIGALRGGGAAVLAPGSTSHAPSLTSCHRAGSRNEYGTRRHRNTVVVDRLHRLRPRDARARPRCLQP